MKILHTSDWHLGRTLYGRKRYHEFEAFLTWLLELIEQQQIDVLLVAGDIFDNSVPSHRAQKLYYQFLYRIAHSCCRHIVITAGNHDSPSFLNAPQALLKTLNIHVIGEISSQPHDEVLVLTDPQEVPELIVCAVPYLRDRDIRLTEAGESLESKTAKLIDGISQHYDQVVSIAEQQRSTLSQPIPIIAMGHLFTIGGQTVDGDGVRELYIGSLAHIPAYCFPSTLDYVALGHLHVPQPVKANTLVRYSGSPIPMGFGEAGQQKSVTLLTFFPELPMESTLYPVPVFQHLQQISGDWATIENTLTELRHTQRSVWLEIVYTGEAIISNLREQLDALVEGSQLEILRIKNSRLLNQVLTSMNASETLDDLNVYEVFERCLQQHQIPEEQRSVLQHTYQEVIASLQNHDANAE